MIDGERTLNRLLSPFDDALSKPDTREVVVNRLGEFGVQGANGWSWFHDDRLTFDHLDALGRLAAQVGIGKPFDPEHPTRSSRLPGSIPRRITVSRPTATEPGAITLAIRQRAADFTPTLELFQDQGYFSLLPEKRDWPETLTRWVAEDRCNIEITASTGGGKTTLVEALGRKIPQENRIILLQSAPEILLPHRNLVSKLYDEKAEGGEHSSETMLANALREAPDNIIWGETRTGETWAYVMRALNTGHQGCISTTHANRGWEGMENALLAQIRQNHFSSGVGDETVRGMIRSNIHVLICVEYAPKDKIPYRATLIERRAA